MFFNRTPSKLESQITELRQKSMDLTIQNHNLLKMVADLAKVGQLHQNKLVQLDAAVTAMGQYKPQFIN